MGDAAGVSYSEEALYAAELAAKSVYMIALPVPGTDTRVLTGRDQLLGRQVPQPAGALHRPGTLRPGSCPGQQLLRLRSDGNNDTAPSAVAGVGFPVHVLTVSALGLHLLDYLQFTELSQVCAQIGRWSFLCVSAPLRLPTGTGSPVNPIAIV